jgi:hypothetical protein
MKNKLPRDLYVDELNALYSPALRPASAVPTIATKLRPNLPDPSVSGACNRTVDHIAQTEIPGYITVGTATPSTSQPITNSLSPDTPQDAGMDPPKPSSTKAVGA